MGTKARSAFDQAYARRCGESICAVLEGEGAGTDRLDDAFREWDAFVDGGGGGGGDEIVASDELTTITMTMEMAAPRAR